MFHKSVILVWLALPALLAAQPATLPVQHPANHLFDRLGILHSGGPIHPEVRPFGRDDAVAFARWADTTAQNLSKLDRADLQYLYDDNNEWLLPADSLLLLRSRKPLFGRFFRTPANLFEVNTPAFRLRANPMLHFAAGRAQDDNALLFANQRGLEVRGDVDGRVFFYTSLVETQARFPNYVNRWIADYQAVPGAGFYKPYRSRAFDIRDGYDFNLASAHIGFQITKHVGLQLGHGRHFIGNGYRSLFLSDAGNLTYFLKLNTRVWRLHYQNLFLELSPISTAVPRPQNSILPKKYVAAHYLSLRVTPNLAVGFFEATVFNRSRQFELQYLNPVILYRSVEGMLGSPDNVLVGLDARWDVLRRVRLYGQLLIDEFYFSEVFKPGQSGWWGNKFGAQLGLKYVNAFGVDHLDVQVEFNAVRPYTYSSFDSLNSFTHYNQPLAHPLWANFREIIGIARYQPTPRWLLTGRLLYAKMGDDGLGENWGGNPLLGNAGREQEYGNTIGQGVSATTLLAGLDASWQWRHNLFWEARFLLRTKNSADAGRDLNTRWFTLGLRWNMWSGNLDF
ncbi:MAG: hypothetical protein IPM98_05890 [Lewinellaceae bacterium]|nr:hypothetical protein [Lewinellaceae bacterium]